MMLPDVVLWQPEIPANTGNIIRLAANTGFGLHLVAPLGFEMDDRRLRRAGLDYHEWARLRVHENWPELLRAMPRRRRIMLSSHGRCNYFSLSLRRDDLLVFGPETRGLPQEMLAGGDIVARLPMQPQSRSLNLANAVAVCVFEAWRQLGFEGALADAASKECSATR